MKLLLDQNISFRLKKKLEHLYPKCLHISDCGLKNSEDLEIWNYAKLNGYAVITYDADFFELSLINGAPPKVIWIRANNLSTTEVAQLLESSFDEIDTFINRDDSFNCLELGI